MDAGILTAVAVSVVLIVAIVLHVWYARGLSRVFAARGAESWRAWVPLVNEAEVFRLGRIDPVRAVLLIVPFVNIYALVLKATAASRLGAPAGRGAGTTTLALVFPPVWAAILAAPTSERDAESTIVDAPGDAPSAEIDRSGPIVSVPGSTDGSASAGTAAGTRRSAASVDAPVLTPTLAGPVEVVPPGQVGEAPEPAASAMAPEPGTSLSAAAGDSASAAAASAAAASAADSATAFEGVVETTDATAPPAAVESDVPTAAPLDESTQTARPRSRRRGQWTLGLPDGRRVAVTGRTVVLGRKPAAADDTVQHIVVPDDTRTVSKQHARLDWTVTGWTITDLGSTNGVTLVQDDGRSERVRPDTAALLTTRFRLGDAALELVPVVED